MRSEQEVSSAIETYSDTVRRICMTYLKSYSDSEDIFQTVFMKYALTSTIFENATHEKAWFIRVTINACKDFLKSFFRKNIIPVDTPLEVNTPEPTDNAYVLQAVCSLPEKYRIVIYLFYYEGYTAVEIGQIISKKTNTVYTLLSRGKTLLKDKLGEDYIE